jgi:hypothetical protein
MSGPVSYYLRARDLMFGNRRQPIGVSFRAAWGEGPTAAEGTSRVDGSPRQAATSRPLGRHAPTLPLLGDAAGGGLVLGRRAKAEVVEDPADRERPRAS